MNESSALDDDDGDEGSGDDDEGDGDESATPAAEGEDQEMKDAPAYPLSDSTAEAPPAITPAEAAQSGANLAPPPLVTDPVQLEGSPLKNVTMRSPTDPSPHLSPIAATATASAGAVLSGVPGESTLGLQPSVPEPQQPVLLSQAFFRGDNIDKNPAEQTAPVPRPAETAPAEDSMMEDVTSTVIEPQETGPEPVPDQAILTFSEDTSAPPIVEPLPAVEAVSIAEPPSVVEGLTAIGAAPVAQPAAVDDPPAVVEPPSHVEELPAPASKEDVPLPTSEQPMPGQTAETIEQQAPAAAESAPPSPVIAPAPAPAPSPSPPPVAQAPAEEVVKDLGPSDVKTESGGVDHVFAEGESVEDVVVEDKGAVDVVAETTDAQDDGAKDTVAPGEAQIGAATTEGVGNEDTSVGTEDVVTEDGSFDILGSLSTSLNQQAEDDVPPPSLPPAPTDTAIHEPALPVQSNEATPATQPHETDMGGQAAEAVVMGPTEQTGNIGESSETVQAEQSSDVKAEGTGAQTQDLPERPGEEK